MESEFVNANGIRLHYLDHGGQGPTVVLLPGLTANAHFFDAVVEEGIGEGMRAIAVDLRGRGLSSKPEMGYSMADHTEDVLGLVQTLGLGSITIVGHSFGGLVALYLAAHHPDCVSKIVVHDTPIEVDAQVVEQVAPSLARLDATYPSFASYIETVRAQPYFEDWWDIRIETYYRADVEELSDGAVRPRSTPSHIQQAIEHTIPVDWAQVAASVTVPTLLIRARGPFGPPGYPALVTAESAKRTVDALGDGQVVEVDGNHLTSFYGDGAHTTASIARSFILEEPCLSDR